MIKPSDVSIIIPHLGATKEQCYSLKECLTSLQENSPEIRVIVVKNGSTGCDCYYDIRVMDQGQCKAVNAAVVTTNTRWIFISNDDMIFPPSWFFNLTVGYPVKYKNICLSPKLVEPRSGAPTFLVEFCGGAGGDFNKQKFLDFAENYPLSSGVANYKTGFNFPVLMRRDLWDLIGTYDINYDPWGSNGDSDLQYKIMLAGIQPMQVQNCLVYHFSQTSGTFESKNDSYRFKNYAYFKEKWGFERTDNGIWESNFTIPSKEEGRIYLPEWEGKYV